MRYKCLRCSWNWISRLVNQRPVACPHCNSRVWNKKVKQRGKK